MFITYWLKVCFIFSPAKVTLLGSVIFTFQHTKQLAISKHNLMFLYTIFLVTTKVRVQSSRESGLQILCDQNSAYKASNRNIYFLLLLQSKKVNFGEFIQHIHGFLNIVLLWFLIWLMLRLSEKTRRWPDSVVSFVKWGAWVDVLWGSFEF